MEREEVGREDEEVEVLIKDLLDALDRAVAGDGFGELLEERAREGRGEVDVGGGVEVLGEVGGDAADVGLGGRDEVDGGDVGEGGAFGVQLPAARE